MGTVGKRNVGETLPVGGERWALSGSGKWGNATGGVGDGEHWWKTVSKGEMRVRRANLHGCHGRNAESLG